MGVILFIPPWTKNAEEVRSAVKQTVPQGDMEICLTVDALLKRLRGPVQARTIAILFPASPDDLAGLLEINEFLDDLRIILILADADESTVALGHRLRPRVVLQGDAYLLQLLPILENMIQGPRRRAAQG